MKHNYPLLILTVTLISCTPSKQETCSKIDEALRQQYEDVAFKESKSLKIYELKTVDFKLVGEGYLDTLQLINCKMRERYHSKMAEIKKLQFDIKARYAELGKEINGYASRFEVEQVKEKQAELVEAGDSLNYYLRKEAQILARLKSRKQDPKDYYSAKTFVKMVSDDKHIMDTLYFTLDKDLKLINNR